MHSLESEYAELKAVGIIDEVAAERGVALQRGAIFSLHEELRVALYVSVAAIVAGVGMVLKENLDRVGPLTLIVTLALVAAACYGTAIRTRRRGQTRSIGGDYLLLLGALIVSAELGYVESEFHWLGAQWSWYLLVLAALHAITAYALDSRLVLSVSLASLAGWFGIEAHADTPLATDGSLRNFAFHALICAGLMEAWRALHHRLRGSPSFESVFETFVVSIGFWGALSLIFHAGWRWIGLAVLLGLAVVSVRRGLRGGQQSLLVYGVCYATLGVCSLEAEVLKVGPLMALIELLTVIASAALLWQFHRRVKRQKT